MKKNNSLLVTILGGAIFCFVCLGMVFLFPGSTKKLNSSNESAFPNADEHGYVNDEEISLGDDNVCTSRPCVEYNQCSSGTLVGSRCYKSPYSAAEGNCAAGESWSNGQCHDATGTPATCKRYECQGCIEGYTLQNGECVSDPVITCLNPTYNGSSQTIATCANGSIISGATATEIGSNYTVSCQGSKLVSKNCSIQAGTADPVITCLNPTYNGSSQTIATCANGSIISGGTATAVGNDYTVSCQGSKLVTKQCSIQAATGCDAGEYKGSEACERCPNGYISDEGGALSINECYVNAGLGKQVASAHASVTDCPVGTYSDTSKRVKYGDTKSCTSCGEDKTTDSTGATSANQCKDSTDPEITCLNPKYTGAAQTIATCKNGTITSGATAVEHGNHVVSCQGSKLVSKECPIVANEGVVCCCTTDKAMCSWQKSCDASKPSPVQGVTTEQSCKAEEKGDIAGTCKVSASISSVATSVATDGESDPNSYYTVTVKITGRDCGGQTVNYSATNGRPSPGSYKVSENAVSVTTSFYVRPIDPCKDSSATATLSNGSSSTVTLGKDAIRTDWQKTDKNVCEKNPQYTAFYLADMDGANIYYSNYDSSQGCYTVKWRRYLCGSGGIPTTPTTPAAPHCYTDDNGNYYWTLNPDSNWKIVDNITKEDNCKKEEADACYLTPSGTYEWGKHAKDDGYVLITAITTSDACKAPTPTDACYKKDNSYIWTSTQPEGYTKVEDAKTPADCTPPENPACYLHGNSFVWGKYEKITGYIFVENIDEEANCKNPDTDACYVDSKGDYVWGKYSDVKGYTLVPSVTNMSQCKNNVPVPKTDISISKIIYISMAILMAFGVGFIYYSSTAKKNN